MDKTTRTNRMIELLNKDDFGCEDYEELKGLIAEDEREYYRLKQKYKEAVFGSSIIHDYPRIF